MNEHHYELLQVSRSKMRQYEREAAQYHQIQHHRIQYRQIQRDQISKGRLRHRLALSLRTLAERLEPETAPSIGLERSL